MIVVSLVWLFVYLFGAYAYGAATVYGVRGSRRLWAPRDERREQQDTDQIPLALFVISTAWFVLHTLIEFRNLTGDTSRGWLDLGTFMVYFYPPVIMQTVYREAACDQRPLPPAIYRHLLTAMFVVSPLIGAVTLATIFDVIVLPVDIDPLIGISIGLLFILASIYSTAIMLRRRPTPTPNQARLRTVMIGLYVSLGLVFAALIFLQEQQLAVAILERVARSSPIYFLIASIYFENRFEFYDLVVKRGLLILLSMIVLGTFFAGTLPWLTALPAGAARPWLFAVALVPVAMVMPWLHARLERWLDRIWLGREFTPVEAVKHVLLAMQPATDEPTLLRATESRLCEIFGARIAVLLGDQAPPAGLTIESEVAMPSPDCGPAVRIAVLRVPGLRPILSEDLALLRSLAGVFGFMLENLRLQCKRQEQDLIAQDLRLQSSKSELKALRAQINPHFLFNALNAIASLIHTDPARADEAVEQLAEVFRYTLRRSGSEWAPLDQELTFARAYLDVEQARFGQRLSFAIDSDHPAPAPHIPSMLLQTLLENAVKHGVSQSRDPGRIDVIVRSTSGEVTIEVRNTGPATAAPGPGPRDGEGFGLHSVRERLKGHFGDGASFSLTRDEAAGVTIARIVMPLVRMAA